MSQSVIGGLLGLSSGPVVAEEEELESSHTRLEAQSPHLEDQEIMTQVGSEDESDNKENAALEQELTIVHEESSTPQIEIQLGKEQEKVQVVKNGFHFDTEAEDNGPIDLKNLPSATLNWLGNSTAQVNNKNPNTNVRTKPSKDAREVFGMCYDCFHETPGTGLTLCSLVKSDQSGIKSHYSLCHPASRKLSTVRS
jgi:hypothetical protein